MTVREAVDTGALIVVPGMLTTQRPGREYVVAVYQQPNGDRMCRTCDTDGIVRERRWSEALPDMNDEGTRSLAGIALVDALGLEC